MWSPDFLDSVLDIQYCQSSCTQQNQVQSIQMVGSRRRTENRIGQLKYIKHTPQKIYDTDIMKCESTRLSMLG